MRFTTKWVRKNGNTLWLYRRFLFFWQKHEPFSNKERKLELKKNKLSKELEDVHQEWLDLQADKKRINRMIDSSHETEEGHGPLEIRRLPLFRPSVLPAVEDCWSKFTNVLRGRKTIAEQVKSVGGIRSKETDSLKNSEEVLHSDDEHDLVVGERDVDVVRRNDNNNRKNRNKNNQNNN